MIDLNDELIPENELARMIHRHPKTLQRWRQEGNGPPFLKLGDRSIFYRRSSLEAYFANTEKVQGLKGRMTGRKLAVQS